MAPTVIIKAPTPRINVFEGRRKPDFFGGGGVLASGVGGFSGLVWASCQDKSELPKVRVVKRSLVCVRGRFCWQPRP